ncbi:MAG: hypothetical protein ACRBFS_11345 [Aureispira sp.]
MKMLLLPFLFCLQIACTSSVELQHKTIPSTLGTALVRDTTFWAEAKMTDGVDAVDSLNLSTAYEWWIEGRRLQEEEDRMITFEQMQEKHSFQSFKDSYVLSKKYAIDATHRLVILGMEYADNYFEVLLLTKDSTNNSWWLSDATGCYTRYVLREQQILFDSTTRLLFLIIGDFHSDMGDADSRMIYQVEGNQLQEAGYIHDSGFFDLDLEWSAVDSTVGSCELSGLYSYRSDWTIVDRRTLELKYELEVLLTHKAPYPWPDADTIHLDGFTVFYTWQDSLQAFVFDETQSLGISQQVLENRQIGSWDDLLLEELMVGMRQNTGANYYSIPCIREALATRKMPQQVY